MKLLHIKDIKWPNKKEVCNNLKSDKESDNIVNIKYDIINTFDKFSSIGNEIAFVQIGILKISLQASSLGCSKDFEVSSLEKYYVALANYIKLMINRLIEINAKLFNKKIIS